MVYDIPLRDNLSFYLFQSVHDDDDDNEPNLHVLGLEYKFKF